MSIPRNTQSAISREVLDSLVTDGALSTAPYMETNYYYYYDYPPAYTNYYYYYDYPPAPPYPSVSSDSVESCKSLLDTLDGGYLDCREVEEAVREFLEQGCMSQLFEPGNFEGTLKIAVHGPVEITYIVDSDVEIYSSSGILPDLQGHLDEILIETSSNPFGIIGFLLEPWSCSEGSRANSVIYYVLY